MKKTALLIAIITFLSFCGGASSLGAQPEQQSSPFYANGFVHVASKFNLFCLAEKNGSNAWSYAVSKAITQPPFASGRKVYLATEDNAVFVLDAKTGALSRKITLSAKPSTKIAFDGSRVYFGGVDDRFYCLEDLDGQVAWSVKTGQLMCPPGVSDKEVFFVTKMGLLYVVRKTDGSVQWTYPLQHGAELTPIQFDGRLYVCTHRFLACFDYSKNKKMWLFGAKTKITSGPSGFVIGTEDGMVYGVDKLTGKLRWSFSAGSKITTNTVFLKDKALFATQAGLLYAVFPEVGKKAWTVKVGNYIENRLATSSEFVFFTSFGALFCYNQKGGKIWSFTFKGAK